MSFGYTVLLRSVWSREIVVVTLLYEEVFNGGICEFQNIVTSDPSYLVFDESFNSYNKVDEFRGCF